MANQQLRNKKLIMGVSVLVLVSSLGANKVVGTKLIQVTEKKDELTSEKGKLTDNIKMWETNRDNLDYIKKMYPLQDGEQSLLSFMDNLVRISEETQVEIIELKVNLKTLFTENDLVNTQVQVKLRGDTDKIKLFTDKTRNVEFVGVTNMKTVYNSKLGLNDNIINYTVTGRYSRPNLKLKNPNDIISRVAVYTNLTGEWVDYELYKKQIKELESVGRVITQADGQPQGGTQGDEGNITDHEDLDLSLDGFEEVTDAPQPPPSTGNTGGTSSNTNKPSPPSKPAPNKPKEEIIKDEPFQNPLDTMELLQGFSNEHQGITLKAKLGTQVKTVASGKVIQLGELGEFGKTVMLEHKKGEISMYANLSEVSVKMGDELKKGVVLGKTGKLGETEQLYFAFANGDFIDPLEVFKVNSK